MEDLNRPRVLIVDDDRTVRGFVAVGLGDDCVVDEACDAETALEAATARPPDLVLLDVSLGGHSGLDILIDLREKFEVPVVMLTAASDEATEWRSRDLGAAAFVAKPVDADDLRRLVLQYLPST
ncbi:MAG: response regulator [Actinomycetota bacterium]